MEFTMLVVKEYLDKKQSIFAHHPFFFVLNKQDNFSEGMAFVPRLMFWVMAFQDILNIIPPPFVFVVLKRGDNTGIGLATNTTPSTPFIED